MVIDEKGLLSAMKDAYKKKSTGYKVAARISPKGERELILSGPGWSAEIARENAPRKVLGVIVEHVGDLPDEGMAFQVQEKNVQTEIFNVAVPDPAEPVAGARVKRTNLTYNGYQIWQRMDDLNVFMVAPKIEDLLDNYNREVRLTEDGAFYVEGIASRLHIQPLQVQQNELPALHHLAKMQWA